MNKKFFAVTLLASVMGFVSASTEELSTESSIIYVSDAPAPVVSTEVAENPIEKPVEEVKALELTEGQSSSVKNLEIPLDGIDPESVDKVVNFCLKNKEDCIAALLNLLKNFEGKQQSSTTIIAIVQEETTNLSTTTTENLVDEKQVVENAEAITTTEATTTSTESSETAN